jgi:hypothetical protein
VKLATQTIERIGDNVAPVFASLPVNQTIACNQSPVFEELSATDNCSTAFVTFTDAISSSTCEQVHTRTWTATDANGNVATTQQIIVAKDEDAPFFNFVPANKEQDCMASIQFGLPLAGDLCGTVTITQTDVTTAPICGNSGQIITRTWSAFDVCGNVTTATQSIKISEDVIAPTFTEQVTAILEMTAAQFSAWTPINPASEDQCNEAVEVNSSITNIDECNYELLYKASDLCGNTTTQIQKVHIIDGTCAPSGTFGLENASLKIYPNPASDVLFVESINNTVLMGSRYEVIDMLGRILVSGELNSNLESLNLSTLPNATYTLRINHANKPIVLVFEKISK